MSKNIVTVKKCVPPVAQARSRSINPCSKGKQVKVIIGFFVLSRLLPYPIPPLVIALRGIATKRGSTKRLIKMAKIRTKKTGYVYILKSDSELFDKPVYKYGCTQLTPEKRCKAINYKNKHYGNFSLIASIKSNDIYEKEKQLKWILWHIFAFEEFFICSDSDFKSLVLPFFGDYK